MIDETASILEQSRPHTSTRGTPDTHKEKEELEPTASNEKSAEKEAVTFQNKALMQTSAITPS